MGKIGMIFSGGIIEQSFALEEYEKRKPKIVIGVDRGLEFLYQNTILPTHIVGDFDSVNPEVIDYYKKDTNIPVRQFDPVKDASDTEIAIRLAIELGVEELYILGGTGTRLDHVWANVQTLKVAHDAGVNAYIMDKYNRISLVEQKITLSKENAYGPFFSVFPLGETVSDFSIRGAKYPLENHTLYPYDSLTVSNQFSQDEVHIVFPKGIVILMETRDSK